jgi:hypothetical protein
MRTIAVCAALAVAVAALQSNPHSKVKKTKPLTPALNKRDTEIDNTSDFQFLTNTTQRAFIEMTSSLGNSC